MGTTAATVAAAPFVVVVGLAVGGAVVPLELICASQNHPKQVEKVRAASEEFATRFASTWQRVRGATSQAASSAVPAIRVAQIKVKTVVTDIWQYAYQIAAE